MDKWPNFFIVGAPKAGTTSLYAYLEEIPDIYMSPVKEPKYFSKISDFKYRHSPIREKKEFLKLFAEVTNEIAIGEASTNYLEDPASPLLIKNSVPEARIIIMLRDPIERLFSNYLMHKRLGFLKKSFHEEIERCLNFTEKNFSEIFLSLDSGMYSESVKRYLDVFGKEKVMIIIFEEFIKNEKETVQNVLKFLEVDVVLKDFKAKVFNPYAEAKNSFSQFLMRNDAIKKIAERSFSPNTRRVLKEKLLTKKQPKPKMEVEDREFLHKYYTEDVRKIKSILGRGLPWPNFTKVKE